MPSRMLKKSASGVLASLRGSAYRSVRLASSLAAALLNGLFEHPAKVFFCCATCADICVLACLSAGIYAFNRLGRGLIRTAASIEGLDSPRLPRRGWPDCPSLRASSDHGFIVRLPFGIYSLSKQGARPPQTARVQRGLLRGNRCVLAHRGWAGENMRVARAREVAWPPPRASIRLESECRGHSLAD